MAKAKTTFFCQNCGYEAPKWLGKCPSCSEWNTFVEERIEKSVPQPVPGPTQIVPIFISQSTSGSRSLRSTLA